MKHLFIILLISAFTSKIAAQQNWAAIPCSKLGPLDGINKMFIDSLHNELILNCASGTVVCNSIYKGLFAYNGSSFHALDKGVDTHDINTSTGNTPMNTCITYGDKTLFGGVYLSVGSNALLSKSNALWNGNVWDTFPKHVFRNDLNIYSGGFYGFLKHNGKLWFYGGFDTIGNVATRDMATFDGNTFSAVPPIPVTNRAPIFKMVAYKNKLIANGNFYNSPSFNYWRLAQFDGTGWSPVGSGVRGNLTGAADMAVYKDTLYIAGNFSKADGNAGNMVMKWDGSQLMDAGFGGWCSYGPIYRLLTFKNRLYAFGAFLCAANQKAFGVAYYENGAWTVPQDSLDDAITGAEVYNGTIYISGFFKSINGDTTIQRFAKLMCSDFDVSIGCISAIRENSKRINLKIFPNPTNGKIQLEFEQGGGAIDNVSISNVLGQALYSMKLPATRQEVDLSRLPAGIYFLKAENKQGQGMFKVVKE